MLHQPSPPATLEEALAKVAADYQFTSLDVGMMTVGGRPVWTATVHYAGPSLNGQRASLGSCEASIREALYDAIRKAAANRAPLAIMPPALPALDMAEAA